MNLRTLKKLSKRAAALLPRMGEKGDIYPSEGDGVVSWKRRIDRKHWSRMTVSHGGESLRGNIKYPSRATPGHWIVLSPPYDPWPGTMMVGWMDNSPDGQEWDEENAWGRLCELAWWHLAKPDFSDPDAEMKTTPPRGLRSPSDYLRAAEAMALEKEAEEAVRAAERQKFHWNMQKRTGKYVAPEEVTV